MFDGRSQVMQVQLRLSTNGRYSDALVWKDWCGAAPSGCLLVAVFACITYCKHGLTYVIAFLLVACASAMAESFSDTTQIAMGSDTIPVAQAESKPTYDLF